jgi:methionyl-tRNA formyltransferase
VDPAETSADLHDRLAVLGGSALVEALALLEAGALTPVRQDAARATLAPIIEKEHGRLDFRLPAARLACRVRAFTPWPGAFTTLGGRILKVHRAAVAGPGELAALPPEQRVPGRAVSTGQSPRHRQPVGDILVCCGEGSGLRLLEVQLEGKRRLSASKFLQGAPLPADAVLGP